jgi:hypothetical protein
VTVTTLAAGTTTYTSETTVAVGDTLRFPPNSSATLVMDNKNLIIYGTLEMKPSGPNIVHTLQFINVNEANFVGAPLGGMSMVPVATDIGLWVMDTGIADLQGSPKVGWNRTGTDPSWDVTDELLSAPWAAGDYTSFATHTLGAAPETLVDPWGTTHTQEVFNLTRNVRIEGTAGHKAHALIMTPNVAQTIKYVQFRHLGPRTSANPSAKIRGRWSGVHFHHMGDSYTTTAVGCVVRDGGSHAYVSHASHGTTFTDCIAYNINEDAYWWDSEVAADLSDDVTYDHCLAAKLVPIPSYRGNRLTGFWLGETALSFADRDDPTPSGFAFDCMTVGNQGNDEASGYHWQEQHHAVWTFQGCGAHNNKRLGIYIWQNGPNDLLEDFTAFRNLTGVTNGAYRQQNQYRDAVLFDNTFADMEWLTVTQPSSSVGGDLRNSRVENLLHGDHVQSAENGIPTLIENSTLGHVTVNEFLPGFPMPARVDFVNCTQDGSTALELADFTVTWMHVDSVYRVQRPNGTAFQVNPDGSSDVIAAFAEPEAAGAFAAAAAALAGTGTVGISHGAFAAAKPAFAGTGTHQISISGTGAVAVRKPAFAGIGTGTTATTGHIEGGAASFQGQGSAAAEAVGGAGFPPFRVRSLRRSIHLRGVASAHVRGEGGTVIRSSMRLRPLAVGSRLRGALFPSSVRAGSGIVAVTGTGAFAASPATLAAFGDAGPVAGFGGIATAAASFSGTGTETIVGAGGVVAAAASLSGTGAESGAEVGNLAAGAAILSGTGAVASVGSGDFAAAPASFAGTGSETITGTGAFAGSAAALSGQASETITGAGAFAAVSASLSGSGVFATVFGDGAFAGLAAALGGTGEFAEILGEATFAANAAALSGVGTVLVIVDADEWYADGPFVKWHVRTISSHSGVS